MESKNQDERRWHDSDWIVSALTALAMALTVAGNYILHGGHIQW